MSEDSSSEADAERTRGAEIIARQDRIPLWSLSYIFIGILGVGYVFIFFDIFNINVSFVQTAAELAPTATNIPLIQGPIVLWNLIGYVVGAMLLTPFSDRLGRREMLMLTLLITGVGSVFNAFATDLLSFTIWRFITGIGVGADLAIVNAYINEVAPTNGRARYTSLLFILAGIGVVIAIWLGLLLTTPIYVAWTPGSWMSTDSWRLMYGIGGALALVGVVLRLRMPESTRWLITHGHSDKAETIVADMEKRALTHIPELPPLPESIQITEKPKPIPYMEIFKNPLYRNRTILLFLVWFFGYMTVYINAAGLTGLLAAVGFAEQGPIIVAYGIFGFVIAGIIAALFGDKFERKYWLPIAAAITLVGSITMGLSGSNIDIAILGALLIFIGMDVWVPISYAWVSESFPTRARASGFALADGLGHLGGGIGLIIVGWLLGFVTGPTTALIIFIVIALFQIISAVIAQFGPKTSKKRLDELSP